MFSQQRPYFRWIVGMGLACRVCVHGEPRRSPRKLFDELGEGLLGGPHERRVEARRDGKPGHPNVSGFEALLCPRDRFLRSGNDRLHRSVEIGADEIGDIVHRGDDVFPARGDRGHGSEFAVSGRLDDEPASRLGHAQQVGKIQHTRRVKGDVFTIAVSCRHVRLQPDSLQKRPEARLDAPESGLGDIGAGQSDPRRLLFLVGKPGRRKNQMAQGWYRTSTKRRCRGKDAVGLFHSGGQLRERRRQFSHHVGILGSLTREQHRDLRSGPGGFRGEIDVRR